MSEYEKNIERLYQEPVFAKGGGVCRSPWDIDWQDEPFSPQDETLISPIKLPGIMKDIWEKGEPTKTSAVYIHVPFCRLSCTYCAFYKKQADEAAQHAYANLLVKEIQSLQNRPYLTRSKISSIFFGGGTPGILSAADISSIMEAIHEVLPLTKDAEITMESSLSDMTEEKMDAAISCGVNRFSFGVQSFDTKIRNAVGRPLPREEVLKKLSAFAKKDALMILDLIYGLPGETEETMRSDIRDAKACGMAGLDLYQLHILPNSPLGKQFKKWGKSLEIAVLQSLFRTAEDELGRSGAANISCTHWKWHPAERSLYNTLSSSGGDILPLGMACGGQIGGVGLMKPMVDAMYSAAVRRGKFLPMGARQSSRYRAFYKAIEGAGDRGVIEPARLAKETVLPADLLLTPLLDIWKSWGLVTEAGGVYRYTSSGRYWYRVMIRRMMHAADYMLFGKPDTKKKAHWGGMMNMR